jgi:hypothetical protein
MRAALFIFILVSLIISCNSKTKDKEVTKDTTTTTPVVDTTAKATPVVTKKMSFEGYEEGDYAHLSFKDIETGEAYDFGHPEENNLDGINVVSKDTTASFGYKENTAMKGKLFRVTMEKKMVNTADGNGQPIRAEGWRITSITL